MKKISEMSLEELQDYALTLQSEKTTLEENNAKAAADLDELRKTNLLLQTRNNELFMRVEQQKEQQTPPAQQDQTEEPPESCEDFAANFMKGIYKR